MYIRTAEPLYMNSLKICPKPESPQRASSRRRFSLFGGGHLFAMDTEVWKAVPGYEGHYEASDLGKVRSFKRNAIRILNAGINSNGYYTVNLLLNGKSKNRKVSRIVYESFNPTSAGMVIDHINGNKLDDRLCNLREVTTRENNTFYQLTKKTSSQYTGVCWCKRNKLWMASIKIDGKFTNLGLHDTELEASETYQKTLNWLANGRVGPIPKTIRRGVNTVQHNLPAEKAQNRLEAGTAD